MVSTFSKVIGNYDDNIHEYEESYDYTGLYKIHLGDSEDIDRTISH